MISIDGSQGEGGGQVLRTSLALSLCTGQPFRIENIRARRKTPGLLRQHLTAVNAAAEVGSASVEGAAIGSMALTFTPDQVRGGDYAFAIGTAGSTTLVLQTILLPLLLCDEPSTVTIEGGTHNKAAPPFDFIEAAFLPLLRRMGGRVEVELLRAGFYPAGGGRIRAVIEPSHLTRLDVPERGELVTRRIRAVVANLPLAIAQREVDTAGAILGWEGEAETIDATGPGNAITITVGSEHVTEVFTAFGERGVRAEQVAEKAASEAKRYLESDAAVGEHLADQLLLPMALGDGGSFTTMPLSGHAVTNIDVIRCFLDVPIEVDGARLSVGL
ncbi:MAG TPA: RNA 3'-terminal phosphate cyclase [Thermoanaerobaculia bacterium]|nr:RNA 3'-terminal phosphate cyclase [Thermoanaerobaculia bacterium]